MQLLTITKLRKEIAGQVLFSIDHLAMFKGDRIGIVGNNGSGKTTLLKAIFNKDTAIHYHVSAAMLPQIQDLNQQSGGEKQKQVLLQLLKMPVEILLLDEPSSNLDADNQQWLISSLKKFSGSVIIVSHDRALLDSLANKIWAFSGGQVTEYSGNYTEYQAQLKAAQARQSVAYALNEKKKSRLEAQVIKRTQAAYRVKKGNRGKLSQSDKKAVSRSSHDHLEKKLQSGAKAIEKRIARMPKLQKPAHESRLQFVDLSSKEKHGQTLLRLSNFTLMRNHQQLIAGIDLKLVFGEHLVLRGPNGSGKTSLLTAIAGSKDPKIWRNSSARIGYFKQTLPLASPDETLFALLRRQSKQTNQVILHLLGSLGFNQTLFNRPMKLLSGGERVKANLAAVLLGRFNLLLLDEATNFLDIRAMDALRDFINSYPGGVILVSHDQNFADQIKAGQLEIHQKELINPTVQPKSSKSNQLLLLEQKKIELMSNPEPDLIAIRKITSLIACLNHSPK
ncbi:ATP-binding cassette domain-containing protein [Oenococcus sp.]|uniref:ATP-binding cassette domain-containing protein n=1 Tax=Oenococcus sp. TaxID=1979414 RepID=UPI0039EB8D49